MAIWRFLGVGGSTLRPSGGQNKRLSQFSIADPWSARKSGRFDVLTSKTKSFFEIMVIWNWCKPYLVCSGVKFSKNDGSERNFTWTFYLHNAMPPSNIGPVGPPPGALKIHVFHIFWTLDGVEITRKRHFWTSSVPKHMNRHLTRLSTFI